MKRLNEWKNSRYNYGQQKKVLLFLLWALSEVSKLFRPACMRPEIASRVSVCKVGDYSIFLADADSLFIYVINDIKKLDGWFAAVTFTICETVSSFGISDTSGYLGCGFANIS